MPTVGKVGAWRLVIYPNDHRPAHVHVIDNANGRVAVFDLDCPNGPPELRENYDFRLRSSTGLPRRYNEAGCFIARIGSGFMDVTEAQIAAANRRGRVRARSQPRAVVARYDRSLGRLVVELSNEVTLMFKPQNAEGLERARPAQLAKIVISPSGFGLRFPALDVDLYLPGLLQGFFGSTRWHAAQLGRAGGQATTSAKAAAARENGKLGGRPRKTMASLPTKPHRSANEKPARIPASK